MRPPSPHPVTLDERRGLRYDFHMRSGKKTCGASVRCRKWLDTLVLLAFGAASILSAACGPSSSGDLSDLVQSGAASGYNLLLITLDTVRSDRLGTYGYTLAETPAMDALAATGVQFDEAISPVPITLPSHTTMMTGLYPPRHGVRDNGVFHLADDQNTLAERLKGEGYDTAAFIGCFVLDERFGLDQGFDTYDFEVTKEGFQQSNFDFNQRSAGSVTQAALRWLRDRGQSRNTRPFFMWVHYFDAHVPLQSPLASLPRFQGRPYDAEITYVDQQLGRLIDNLGRLGLRKKTLIVLVGDHGEGLKEHGESTHGLFVYDTTLKVPFILSSPTLFDKHHRIRNRLVSLIDLRPTVEDLLGLAVSEEMDGISLLQEDTDPGRALYIETKMPYYSARCSPLFGVRRHGSKYIEAPEPEFYNLDNDPGEVNNVYGAGTEESVEMAKLLNRLRNSWPLSDGESPVREMSAEEIDRLRSLGYVHSSARAPAGELPDPKAMMRSSRKVTEAIRLQEENRMEEAIRAAREAVRECEGFLDATAFLAEILREAGQPDEAIQVLRNSLEANPLCGTALQLARTFMTLKKYGEMEETLRIAADLDPTNGFIHVLRGDRYSLQERLPEALSEYEKALEVDEHRTGMLVRPQIQSVRRRMMR